MYAQIQLWSSVVGLVVVVAGWVHYLALIPQEKVPARPTLHTSLMGLSILAVIPTFTMGIVMGQVPSVVSWILAGNVVVLGGFFLYLLTQAPLPDQAIKVQLGEPFPLLTAPDSQGTIHSSETWKGKRVLFKFFRGHW